jgi:hypothetical protein
MRTKPFTSRYRGVFWARDGWRVVIKHNGTKIHLGTFPADQEDAAGRKYNEVALKLLGRFATLNCIEDGTAK